jgi:hypothetical protein
LNRHEISARTIDEVVALLIELVVPVLVGWRVCRLALPVPIIPYDATVRRYFQFSSNLRWDIPIFITAAL